MSQKIQVKCLIAILVLALSATVAQAVTIETVPVGNLGNTGEWSGGSYGGYGPDAFVGAVDYAYNIGTYEVTAGQYTAFLNAVGGVDAYGLYNSDMWSSVYGCKIERYDGSGTTADPYQYRVPDANRTNRPVNYVSWGDAARFSNWLHNGQPNGAQDDSTTEDGAYDLNGATSYTALMAVSREADWKWSLPSEDEWYKAAYHKNDGDTGNYFDYPTSSDNTSAPYLSNDIVDPDPGNNANFYQSGNTIGSPYYTTEVGEFENSESPYDTFDQGGNLWEWNEAAVTGSSRGLRGGGWYGNSSSLAASARGVSYPADEGVGIGFRVASVPEPGSITLLLCGLLSLICLRRRK